MITVEKPWALPAEQALAQLNSSDAGLSTAEAGKRLAEHGPNEVGETVKHHGLSILVSQFRNPLVFVLILAAIVAYSLGSHVEAMVIISIVLINAALGFVQEYRAERAVRELRKYVSLRVKVLRDGKVADIDSKEVVPGDIVYLNIGDVVPADIRLMKAEDMTANESALTGESTPVEKHAAAIGDVSLPQKMSNMAFMGTSVSEGSGFGVVVATGGATFFGRTATYTKKTLETDFHKSIREFGNLLLKVIFVMTLFVFGANAILGKGVFDSFIFALALAVGITPEILPVVITIALSNGAHKMAKEKVVTKLLASVEDLGNMDIICADKTGTLTEGTLSLLNYLNLDNRKDDKLILHGMLCNSAVIPGKGLDNPIDRAILASSAAARMQSKMKGYTLIRRNEFDFVRKRMSVLVQAGKKRTLISKGAPESILKASASATVNGRKRWLTTVLAARIREMVENQEKQGYRVIAIAEKPMKAQTATKADEHDLNLIGFLLFLDPAKSTAKEALDTLRNLKVDVRILTGDSPIVTRKICNDVGLEIREGRVVTGEELDALEALEFEEYCRKYNVFARVTPEHKYRIVTALKKEGHVVGFLGDGINDAPALEAADVGVSVDTAVGIAKEAADIILLKKSLRVLAHGITEGRKIFGNITKYIMNTISANYGNMFTVAISSLFMRFIPLLPSQILLNNFLSDIPNLTISTDNVDPEFVKKPKHWDIKFIRRFMTYFGLLSSVFDLVLILPLIFVFNASTDLFRTAWFVESALSEIIVVFAIRSKRSFFRSMPSKWLIVSSVLTIAFTVAITYTFIGQALFEFVAMPFFILAFIGGVLLTYFISAELAKRWYFRKFEM